MATYFSSTRRPKAAYVEDDWYVTDRPRIEVITESDEATDTGLVDQHGTTIYRRNSREPVGFVR